MDVFGGAVLRLQRLQSYFLLAQGSQSISQTLTKLSLLLHIRLHKVHPLQIYCIDEYSALFAVLILAGVYRLAFMQ